VTHSFITVNLASFGGSINLLSSGKHGVPSFACVLDALIEVINSLLAMARASGELLLVAGVSGSVPGGGCTANPPPVVPGTKVPCFVAFDVVE
jgi:hypothetical protein